LNKITLLINSRFFFINNSPAGFEYMLVILDEILGIISRIESFSDLPMTSSRYISLEDLHQFTINSNKPADGIFQVNIIGKTIEQRS
jgi:hypothetical protein